MKFIDATFTIPMTILLVMALIGFTMIFYTDLEGQVALHKEERSKIYGKREVLVIRTKDRLKDEVE